MELELKQPPLVFLEKAGILRADIRSGSSGKDAAARWETRPLPAFSSQLRKMAKTLSAVDTRETSEQKCLHV